MMIHRSMFASSPQTFRTYKIRTRRFLP